MTVQQVVLLPVLAPIVVCGLGVVWGGGCQIQWLCFILITIICSALMYNKACSSHCCILQTSFAGATLLTVVDQFALNVLDDNDTISTETIGECRDTHLTFTRRQT